jgi:hypothetical protein
VKTIAETIVALLKHAGLTNGQLRVAIAASVSWDYLIDIADAQGLSLRCRTY